MCSRLDALPAKRRATSAYVWQWYAQRAAGELLAFRDLIDDFEHRDVLRVILSRVERSARRAAHFDLEAPREAQIGEYWCHKHKRMCRPVETAVGFLRQYTLDTLTRIEEFARVRDEGCAARVVHGDAPSVDYDTTFDGIVTSPLYPGLIDYHEQHRYAYELLGLGDAREHELGAAEAGTSRAAIESYVEGIARALARAADALVPGAPTTRRGPSWRRSTAS